jgi:hypothetical protein
MSRTRNSTLPFALFSTKKRIASIKKKSGIMKRKAVDRFDTASKRRRKQLTSETVEWNANTADSAGNLFDKMTAFAVGQGLEVHRHQTLVPVFKLQQDELVPVPVLTVHYDGDAFEIQGTASMVEELFQTKSTTSQTLRRAFCLGVERVGEHAVRFVRLAPNQAPLAPILPSMLENDGMQRLSARMTAIFEEKRLYSEKHPFWELLAMVRKYQVPDKDVATALRKLPVSTPLLALWQSAAYQSQLVFPDLLNRKQFMTFIVLAHYVGVDSCPGSEATTADPLYALLHQPDMTTRVFERLLLLLESNCRHLERETVRLGKRLCWPPALAPRVLGLYTEHFLKSVCERWLPGTMRILWRHLMTFVWSSQEPAIPARMLQSLTQDDVSAVLRDLCAHVDATGLSIMEDTAGNRATRLVRRVRKLVPQLVLDVMQNPVHATLKNALLCIE